MNTHTTINIEQYDAEYGEVASYCTQISDLEFLRPHEAPNPDYWRVREGDETVGIAVVDPDADNTNADGAAWIHRIGVLDEQQGNGYGRALLERLHDEYGTLELEVDSRKDANAFYDAVGMDLVEERYAVLNDGSEGTLNVWRLAD